MLLQHSSINRVPKILVKLVKVNLKDAACLGELIGEGFLAFVERENALLKLTEACCLVESVLSQEPESSFDKLTEAIEVINQLAFKAKLERRCSGNSRAFSFHKEGVPRYSKIRRQRLIRSGVRPFGWHRRSSNFRTTLMLLYCTV